LAFFLALDRGRIGNDRDDGHLGLGGTAVSVTDTTMNGPGTTTGNVGIASSGNIALNSSTAPAILGNLYLGSTANTSGSASDLGVYAPSTATPDSTARVQGGPCRKRPGSSSSSTYPEPSSSTAAPRAARSS
jgi:hypothetical protein